jgi:hypothetical protein
MIVTDLSSDARQNQVGADDSPEKRSDHTQFMQNDRKTEEICGTQKPFRGSAGARSSGCQVISACFRTVFIVQFHQTANCCRLHNPKEPWAILCRVGGESIRDDAGDLQTQSTESWQL